MIERTRSERIEGFLQEADDYIRYGHNALALDILDHADKQHPDDYRLLYLRALALSRSGCASQAAGIIKKVLDRPELPTDERMNALALAGKLYKLYFRQSMGPSAQAAAQQSARYYKAALELRSDYFPAINAATMFLLAGHLAESRSLANQALELSSAAPDDVWSIATRGEAALLLGDQSKARQYYERAVAEASRNYGTLSSMRSQLLMLSDNCEVGDLLEEVVVIPKIAVFTGLWIDQPSRPDPQFPPELGPPVKEAISNLLEEQNIGFGYSSAACGGDILFAEALTDLGGETNIYLPFARQDFLDVSVGYAGDSWIKRFEDVLAHSTSSFFVTEEGYYGDDLLFRYLNNILLGSALFRGDQLETETIGIALIDNNARTTAGSPREAIRNWENSGLKIHSIDLAEIRKHCDAGKHHGFSEITSRPAGAPEINIERQGFDRRIMSMVFADVTDFTKIIDNYAPNFWRYFLGEIAHLIERTHPRPVFLNTWGDGLFLVFDTVVDAARLCLQLRDMVNEKDWSALSLPAHTNIRIALHTGPVYKGVDPLLKRTNFFGTHVNTAARIEPVTVPGAVYLTEQAASSMRALQPKDMYCEKLGRVPLAKKYGEQSLYVLQWSNRQSKI
jgi:class 3 adenylate cyclase/tetratricopeptide (TPR) repeat protein